MRLVRVGALGVLCGALAVAHGSEVRGSHSWILPAQAEQGALVQGRTDPGTQVEFSGRVLRLAEDGSFLFGLGRDSAAQVELKVRFADGTERKASLQVRQRDYPIERVEGLPPQSVQPPAEIAARIQREQARVAEARLRDDARSDYRSGFRWPATGRISGVYGSQRILNGTPKDPHYGLDIALPTGTPILAPAAGIVSFADSDLYLTGGTVLLDHGHGLSSVFIHMSRLDVRVGQRIEQGQRLGAVGATGRASGPHLHWGLNWFDVRLDPALLLPPAGDAKGKIATE